MTSMDKSQRSGSLTGRKQNVYVVVAQEEQAHHFYIMKIFSSHPKAVDFVDYQNSNNGEISLSIEKWAIT